MRRSSLLGRAFISILAVALAAVLATGLIARRALESAFESYLISSGVHMGPGAGMGRRVIGAAEETFLVGVDRGIMVSAVVAVVLAALAAWLLARYLLGPVRRLTVASHALATGDLSQRVEEYGPDEVAELAGAFNGMAGSLEEAEELRRRLVADVAHELRNPIGALRAQIEGIADGVIPADPTRLDSLVEDVGMLSRLVDDLQELSVAEAGRMRYERAPFDLCETVAAECERVRALVAPGVALAVRCPGRAVTVVGDEFRIGQVVRNLLSNAVRHTLTGEIEVQVDRAAGSVRVTVSDSGEGITAEDLPFIWERFYRADSARSAGTGGTGVGLAISRRIVLDHGGEVFATSRPGAGSQIGFSLTADVDQAPSA
ncbi:MAG: ATP-binding protein [Coriobacteriia bacterium]|nr:ATP-binding protein [Coriobacteriia bacterium]